MRGVVRIAAVLSAATVAGLGLTVAAQADRAHARASHVLNGNENASLHLVHSSGSTLIESGRVTGTLSGTMRASLDVSARFSGSFTLYTRQGQLRGQGTAAPHGSGRYQSFGGTVTITGGTGRYAHAHGRGGFYGRLDRRTYGLKIETRGRFYY